MNSLVAILCIAQVVGGSGSGVTDFRAAPYPGIAFTTNVNDGDYAAIVTPTYDSGNEALSWQNLTNAAKTTTATAAARKLIRLPAGTWVGSNAWPLTINSWVDFDATGSVVRQRSTAGGGSLPLWGDTDPGASFTTTNRVFGGRHWATNNPVLIVADDASKVYMFPASADIANATAPSAIPVALQVGGELHLIASDYLKSEHYDIYYNSVGTIPAKTTVMAPRAYCGDTLVEAGNGYSNRADNVFWFGLAEALSTGGAYGQQFIGVNSNVVVVVETMLFSRSGVVIGSYTTNHPSGSQSYGVISGNIMTPFSATTNGHIGPWFSGGWAVGSAFILENFTVTSPSSVDPVTVDMSNTPRFNNVTFLMNAANTNWIRSRFSASTARVSGSVTVTPHRPNHANVTLSGNPVNSGISVP